MRRDWSPLRITPWSLGLLLAGILLLLQVTNLPQRLDYWLYDRAITLSPAPIDQSVVIVAIDEYSLNTFGRWPWNRALHAQLIDKLAEAGAHTIVLDILFPESSPSDETLALAMAHHGQVVLPVHYTPGTGNQLFAEQKPAPILARAASTLGHAHINLDKDGVARGINLFNGPDTHPRPALAIADYWQPQGRNIRTGFFDSRRDQHRLVPFTGGADTLPAYSYAEVLAAPPAPQRFAGKTVFVGATAAGFGDVITTPFGGNNRPMSGVEFHANAYSASQQSLLIKPAPAWTSPALTLLVLLALSSCLPRMKPQATLLACLATFIVLTGLFWLLLRAFQWHLPVANAQLLPALAFPLAAGVRLAMTNEFLSRQLDDIAKTPQINLPDPARRHPVQLFDHLIALLQPPGWLLADGRDLLSVNNMAPQDLPELTPAQWLHQGRQSWIRLERGDTCYLLGLTLPDDLTREVIQQYLQTLQLEQTNTAQTGYPARESISRQINRVRAATERLGQMQAFIRHSFEHMPDGIIVTDELGVIRFANQHIENWFREPMPSISGLPLARLLEGHDPQERPPWHETVSETLTLRQSRTVDLRIHQRDFLIHLAPFALPESRHFGIIANISDISELRGQQRQHREAIDFISHDVRSPLVSQLALIEQLKRDPSHIDGNQLEQLGRLARRSYHLAEEFVQLARAEQLTETRFYDCELLNIVENARDSVCEQAEEKKIRLHVHGAENLWLKGNAELLERALINLLTNAIQYSPADSSINVQVYRAGHLACLAISDEGTGIDSEELPHLFDRYHRQKRSEISGNYGAGLGLSFVKTVVEKHRGEIDVDSVIGEGTTFSLKLPVADPMS